jgi:hypothetical protein
VVYSPQGFDFSHRPIQMPMTTFVELATLRDDLMTAVRLVGEGEEMVSRYRSLTEELEREGQGNSEAVLLAQEVLKVMEKMQARRIEHRDRLKQQFAEIEGAQ